MNVDLHGCFSAGRPISRTHRDNQGRAGSTSQAEYAGSIPVIGSTLTSSNAVRIIRTGTLVTECHNSIQTLSSALQGIVLRVGVETHGQTGVVVADPRRDRRDGHTR